jgi:VWA domain containing CoxE-like protein
VTETALPLPDAVGFDSARRRTRLLRAGLAVGLLGTLTAAFLIARGPRAQAGVIPAGRTTVVVLDVSWSTSSSYGEIARTVRELASSGRRLGLVVFSDFAYEMFPAGTPAVELRPLIRFFARTNGSQSASPWAASFSGGTRISAGLEQARAILRRDRVSHGSVLLVSDLDDAPADRPLLAAVVLSYLRDGIPLRAVGLNPTRENGRFFQGLLASRPLGSPADHGSLLTPASSSSSLPIALVVVAALFLALLALNEHVGARLSWSREAPR